MGIFVTVVLVIILLSLFGRLSPKRGRADQPVWTLPAITNELDRLETLLLKGESQFAAEILNQLEPEVARIQGPDGNLLRARQRLSAADFFAWTARPDVAKPHLEMALVEIDGVTDADLALELRTRAEASLGLLATVQGPDPLLIAKAREALEREPRMRRPEVVMRLTWVAHRLALIEHQQGRWREARALFERSVAVGRRLGRPGEDAPTTSWDTGARELFWSHGRKAASEAARDLAVVLQSLGDREGTMRWFDEAVALVEGGTLPLARLRLAQALVERATNEPVDAFTGIAGHEALFGRAVEVALSCDTDEGRAAACVAEIARSHLYPPLGLTEKRIEHLRRAMELAGEPSDPAAGFNRTYLQLSLGFALEDQGDRAAAIEELDRAVGQGRLHPDPNVRRFAAQSAYRLHQLYFEEARLADGRRCVEMLEEIAPALVPEERPTFAGMTAHSRGIQHMLEDRPDEARRAFEQAEAIARQAGSGVLSRAVAMDQGRLELRLERPADALPHLRRALETVVPGIDGPENQGRLADIRLSLANAYLMLDQRAEALGECWQAFETGRGAGSAGGREIAAVAAMHLGEAAEDEPAERRRYYEASSRLGRLCGRPRGREVADIVDARLRETSD